MLVQIQRQPVRVGEEREPLARVPVDPHGLHDDALALKLNDGLINVGDLARHKLPPRPHDVQVVGVCTEGALVSARKAEMDGFLPKDVGDESEIRWR